MASLATRRCGFWLAGLLILGAFVPDAFAGGVADCHQYALKAVAQGKANLEHACGFLGLRWEASHDQHHNWCLTVPIEKANLETEIRTGELAKCRPTLKTPPGPGGVVPQPVPVPAPGQVGTRDEGCKKYALHSVLQHAENLKQGCDLKGPQWHPNQTSHYQWCMNPTPFTPPLPGADSGASSPAWVYRDRQSQLALCGKKQTCDEYAKTAVSQQQQNLQGACNFQGPAWDPYHQHHYGWCVSGENFKGAPGQTEARQTKLARCKPLAGSFTIKSITPHFHANGLVKDIDVVVNTQSTQPWSVGDFGHPKYGSLWVRLEATNKLHVADSVKNEVHGRLYSIQGIAGGTLALKAPNPGKPFTAGGQAVTLKLGPGYPPLKLQGVKHVFDTSTPLVIDPEQPSWGCHYYDPEIEVQVHLATTSGIQSQTLKEKIPQAPLEGVRMDRPSGGFVSEECYR